MDIFLSRPTVIDASFSEGLEIFISQLQALGIKPRTLGVTDYPSNSPLDEVLELMEMCKGAIILGYPQIEIKKALLKNNEIFDLKLATEWNHIEASLAYALKLPLLIIHHTGVVRGIFDRGTINNFIYERDLTKPGWCVESDINGAINRWLFKCTLKNTKENRQEIQTICNNN